MKDTRILLVPGADPLWLNQRVPLSHVLLGAAVHGVAAGCCPRSSLPTSEWWRVSQLRTNTSLHVKVYREDIWWLQWLGLPCWCLVQCFFLLLFQHKSKVRKKGAVKLMCSPAPPPFSFIFSVTVSSHTSLLSNFISIPFLFFVIFSFSLYFHSGTSTYEWVPPLARKSLLVFFSFNCYTLRANFQATSYTRE